MNEVKPSLDSGERIHLEWMFENQPELVRQLHRQGKLHQHLQEKNQQALRLVDDLKAKRGLSEDEAFEVASQEVLAPPNGPALLQDPSPPPLPLQEQREVYRSFGE